MCTNIESLGLRNRKKSKTGSKINEASVVKESNESQSALFLSGHIENHENPEYPEYSGYSLKDFNPAEHLPASYFAPPKGASISYAYVYENEIHDEETNLIQSFLKNFTAEEQAFVKSIVKKTKNHYLAASIASLFGVSPLAFSLLYLASLFARGQAQFNLEPSDFQSNHSFDFIFAEGPINGVDSCQDISSDTMCTQFSMLNNGSIILEIVSKIDTDFGFVYGTSQEARLENVYIQNLRSACIKAFNVCRKSSFIENRIESVVENSTDIHSLFGNTTCSDSGIIGRENCQTQTIFKGLSVLGCNKILGINRTSDISVFRQCTDAIRDETRIKGLGTIFLVIFSLCGATCFGSLSFLLHKYRKQKKKEKQPLMAFQSIIERQFETAITLRNLHIIPDEIMQLILEYSYDIKPELFNNFHQHLVLKLNTLIMQKIHEPISKKEKRECVRAASVSTLVAFNQFKQYKDSCKVHNVEAIDEVEMLKLRKSKQTEDQDITIDIKEKEQQEMFIDINSDIKKEVDSLKEDLDVSPLIKRSGVSV